MKPYYQDEFATIYHGDAFDVAPRVQASALISDPPWGANIDTDSTRFSGGSGGSRRRGQGREWGKIKGDSRPFDPTPWLLYERCVLWGSNHFASLLPLGTTLVWVKKSDHTLGSFLSDGEIAWMKGGTGVFVFTKTFSPPTKAIDMGRSAGSPTSGHPTQKPVALMRWCFQRANIPIEYVILDPFMGSGSTLVAAKEDGRKSIGIEIEERHCETAARRLSQGVLSL